MTPDVEFYRVSEDTMRRAQFWDCAICRAIVIDQEAHADWHRRQEGTVTE